MRRNLVNHDAWFKTLLKNRVILLAFFEEFVPDAARFIHFLQFDSVDKERLTLEGGKRTGDILVKARFRDQPAFFLIHLEHQAQRGADLAWRMLEYVVLDRRDFGLPVYPVVVLSHADRPVGGWPPLCLDFPNKRVLEFDFDVIDLARLNARGFVHSSNPAALALTARMRSVQAEQLDLMRDFFVSLASAPIGMDEKRLVAAFYGTYHPMSMEKALKLNKELAILEPEAMREHAIRLTNPFIELGKAEGLKKGRRQEAEALVLRLLNRRLGVLSAAQKKWIRQLTLPKIEALGESLLEFNSRDDLSNWLKQNA